MGLSLQLLVHLSKLLEQHGVDANPRMAQHLVELARKRVPHLLDQSDPGNDHTAAISAVALAMGLEEQGNPGMDSALEWVLRKQLGPGVAGRLTAAERAEIEWASAALDRHRSMMDEMDDDQGLWRPAIEMETRKLVAGQVDPMLIPDIDPTHIEAFARTHATQPPVADIATETYTPTDGAVDDTVEIEEAAPETNRAIFVIDDSPAERTEGFMRAHGPETRPDLIEITGYESSEAGEGIAVARQSDWGLKILLLFCLLLPPLALFVCGFYLGGRRNGAAVGALIAGVLGWIGWVGLTP